MIQSLVVILGCQLAGEIIARLIGLPLPGPVIGIGLLLGLLLIRDRARVLLPGALGDGSLEAVAGVLLAHLSVLFVPAGVGVIQRLDILGQHGLALTVALVVSSVAGLLVTALVFALVDRQNGGAR